MSQTLTTYQWPEVFVNPDFEYDTSGKNCAAEAIADGLTGWGLCCAGADTPKWDGGFGKGMVKISAVAHCSATAEALVTRARELGLLDGTD